MILKTDYPQEICGKFCLYCCYEFNAWSILSYLSFYFLFCVRHCIMMDRFSKTGLHPVYPPNHDSIYPNCRRLIHTSCVSHGLLASKSSVRTPFKDQWHVSVLVIRARQTQWVGLYRCICCNGGKKNINNLPNDFMNLHLAWKYRI